MFETIVYTLLALMIGATAVVCYLAYRAEHPREDQIGDLHARAAQSGLPTCMTMHPDDPTPCAVCEPLAYVIAGHMDDRFPGNLHRALRIVRLETRPHEEPYYSCADHHECSPAKHNCELYTPDWYPAY